MARKKKSNFRKGFRKNKRIGHPAYLIDEDGNMYKYIGITHAQKTNGMDNIPLSKNPDPKDSSKAFVRPLIEKDKPKNFGRRLNGWTFSAEDKKAVKKIIDKDKKQ